MNPTYRAIVTGGTRGIGRAICRALLGHGSWVTLTGTDPARVDAAVEAMAKEYGDASRVAGSVVDVRDRVAVDRVVAETVARFGGLDLLVNNAGVGLFGEVVSMSDTDWHRAIDVNLTGPFYCSRAAIPALRDAGGGWIINIASLAGKNYFSGGAAYCAAKAGVVAFSEALMQEVRADRIRVSVVLPGSVATEFSGHAPSPSDESWKLSPDDVAEVVMDLLRHPARSLPSRVEIRPSIPGKVPMKA